MDLSSNSCARIRPDSDGGAMADEEASQASEREREGIRERESMLILE